MTRQIPHQASYGTVKYNGFIFPPALNASAKLEPIYDDSKRGLMYVRYQIKIEFIICLDDINQLGESSPEYSEYKPNVLSPSSNILGPVTGHPAMTKGTIDPQMAYLRRRLMQPGRHFQIRDVGLGYDLNVNDPTEVYETSGLYDVAWGPKPISLTWESIASNRAARVVWEVELAIPECEDYGSRAKENVPSIFNKPEQDGALPVEVTQVVYNQSWDIDIAGKTVKKYQAILQIRGYVDTLNLIQVLRSSDEYRNYFEPALLEGYIRDRSYSLNNDKTRLAINITDTQHASDFPLPPGVPDIDVDYSISSGVKGRSVFNEHSSWIGWQIWQARLSGRMTLAKGFNPTWRKVYPYFVFLLIIRSRFAHSEGGDSEGNDANTETTYDQFGGGTFPSNAVEEKKVISLPTRFEMGESIFGQEFTFNFQWEVINIAGRAAPFFLRFGCPPNVIMEEQYNTDPHEMWDWRLWRESMYYNRDDEGWTFTLWLDVPNPPDDEGNVVEGTTRIEILRSWDIKQAPFSSRGADQLRFEGDSKMEPCQPTPDFWYTKEEGTFSGFTPMHLSEILSVPVDNDVNIITLTSSMEIIEECQTISSAPLDNPDEPTTISMYQDGNSNQGGTINAALKVPQGPQMGASRPNNTVGDSRASFDPVSFNIEPGDLRDVKIQSLGPASYLLRATGESITTGLPFNAPRTMRWGKGYAVIQKKRVQTTRTCRGEVELWRTRWDITYLVSGSPNGWDAPKSPSNLKHNITQIGTKSSTVFRRH